MAVASTMLIVLDEDVEQLAVDLPDMLKDYPTIEFTVTDGETWDGVLVELSGDAAELVEMALDHGLSYDWA